MFRRYVSSSCLVWYSRAFGLNLLPLLCSLAVIQKHLRSFTFSFKIAGLRCAIEPLFANHSGCEKNDDDELLFHSYSIHEHDEWMMHVLFWMIFLPKLFPFFCTIFWTWMQKFIIIIRIIFSDFFSNGMDLCFLLLFFTFSFALIANPFYIYILICLSVFFYLQIKIAFYDFIWRMLTNNMPLRMQMLHRLFVLFNTQQTHTHKRFSLTNTVPRNSILRLWMREEEILLFGLCEVDGGAGALQILNALYLMYSMVCKRIKVHIVWENAI